MTSNPGMFTDDDVVLGVMVGAEMEDIPGDPLVPDKPIPMVVWGVLWNRIDAVKRITEDVQTGFASWKASYEISNRSEDEIYFGGEFIPISEASDEMLEKIGPDSTGTINGQKVTLVLGGSDGFISYWGAGLTLSPAERINPEIQLETASVEKKKFIFLTSATKKETTMEKASLDDKDKSKDKNLNGGDSEMTEEQKKKMLEDFKAQIASHR
jgi:hypothetical protein